MIKLIAKVTVVTGLDKATKQPISVGPGAPFSVKTEAEADHLVAIGAAEREAPPVEAPPAGEGGEAP